MPQTDAGGMLKTVARDSILRFNFALLPAFSKDKL
jgi:hypothetical protein